MPNDSVIKLRMYSTCSVHYWPEAATAWAAVIRVHTVKQWQLERLADHDCKVCPDSRDTRVWENAFCRTYDVLCCVVKLGACV